jgi:hypothetical protein
VGGAYSTQGRDERYSKFLLENLNGRDCLEDIGIYLKIILEWIL